MQAYREHLLPRLPALPPHVAHPLLRQLLRALPTLLAGHEGVALGQELRHKAFVPSPKGLLCCAQELYDPRVPGRCNMRPGYTHSFSRINMGCRQKNVNMRMSKPTLSAQWCS